MRTALPIVALLSGACVTTGHMRALSPERGTSALYAAPAETILAVAGRALYARGYAVRDSGRLDSLTRFVTGARGPNLWSYGDLLRVAVRSIDRERSRVFVAQQSRLATRPTLRDPGPRLFQAFDEQLPPALVGPLPGARIRLVAPRSGLDGWTGVLAGWTGDTLTLSADAPRPRVPLACIDRLLLSRGRYGHGGEGATVGSLVGVLVGFVIAKHIAANAQPPRDIFEFDSGTFAAGMLVLVGGALVGTGVGYLAGSRFRTEVWSELPPGRVAPHPE